MGFFYLFRILRPYINERDPSSICLILDTMTAHQTERSLRLLASLGISVVFVPGGLTGYVQPLDVGINRPLKHWMSEQYAQSDHPRPVRAEERRFSVATMVMGAWAAITSETITNSFNRLLSSFRENEDFEEIDFE